MASGRKLDTYSSDGGGGIASSSSFSDPSSAAVSLDFSPGGIGGKGGGISGVLPNMPGGGELSRPGSGELNSPGGVEPRSAISGGGGGGGKPGGGGPGGGGGPILPFIIRFMAPFNKGGMNSSSKPLRGFDGWVSKHLSTSALVLLANATASGSSFIFSSLDNSLQHDSIASHSSRQLLYKARRDVHCERSIRKFLLWIVA